jgi:GH25 family lysozyme M1 (1,4-beta-N-acetylmuramidase)
MKLAIDFYSGNGEIDWGLLAETNVRMVINKLSQGVSPDPGWLERCNNAAAHGFEVAVYHYYDYRYTPVQQLEIVAALLKTTPDMQVIADAEYVKKSKIVAGKATIYHIPVPKTYERDLRQFCEDLSASRPVCIYSNKDFFDSFVPNQMYWAHQFPLWVAHYRTGAPLLPWAWSDWWGWQFTDRAPGRKYGTPHSRQADLSYVKGG